LLARFVATGDEAAFAALLRRHGPMVLAVCRRVLLHAQDAEDAFQATFLVLARRAASVHKREAVGNWLYGVAYRTARGARRMRARRWATESQVQALPHPEVEPEEVQDWRPLLDQELSRLPERYRAPLVLCELEGKSRKEVACELRLPEGTLSSRLATARRLLAKRLARYGSALPGGMAAERGALASVPAALFLSTTRAVLTAGSGRAAVAGMVSAKVAALTEGVLRTMFLAKVKTVTVVLFGVAALSVGTGGALYHARAMGPADVFVAEEKPKEKDARRDADEAQALRDKLEAARRQIEQLQAEAEKQRLRADEAAAKAKLELEKVRDAEELASQEAERLLDAGRARKAGRVGDEEEDNAPVGKRKARKDDLEKLADSEARIRKQFEDRRRALQQQLKNLEEQEKKALADLQRKREELQKQTPAAPTKKEPPAGDKLDLILERLERLEKRLDKLERKE
jgi:RNA polymerase sigma factor (sigma-70 family)